MSVYRMSYSEDPHEHSRRRRWAAYVRKKRGETEPPQFHFTLRGILAKATRHRIVKTGAAQVIVDVCHRAGFRQEVPYRDLKRATSTFPERLLCHKTALRGSDKEVLYFILEKTDSEASYHHLLKSATNANDVQLAAHLMHLGAGTLVTVEHIKQAIALGHSTIVKILLQHPVLPLRKRVSPPRLSRWTGIPISQTLLDTASSSCEVTRDYLRYLKCESGASSLIFPGELQFTDQVQTSKVSQASSISGPALTMTARSW